MSIHTLRTRFAAATTRQLPHYFRAMSSSQSGPVESSIRSKLTELFQPITLTITNDSSKHKHHTAMRDSGGGNGETHFSVEIVSNEFTGKKTIQRHRLINNALAEEFQQGLHALSLNTKTPQEVDAQ